MVVLAEPDLKREYETVGELLFTVDVPISVNHLHYNLRKGGKRLVPKAEIYTRNARALINEAIEDQNWTRTRKGIWLYIDLVFYFPDRRIRDSHNCLKLLLDVMETTVYENDYFVLPRIMSVEYDKENPRVEVKVHKQTKQLRLKNIRDTI